MLFIYCKYDNTLYIALIYYIATANTIDKFWHKSKQRQILPRSFEILFGRHVVAPFWWEILVITINMIKWNLLQLTIVFSHLLCRRIYIQIRHLLPLFAPLLQHWLFRLYILEENPLSTLEHLWLLLYLKIINKLCI